MYGFPQPLMPNDVQWNQHRAPRNPQWRPFHRPRAPFRPRHQEFNHRPPMPTGGEEHWCETCDRGFPNEDLLSKHKLQHQKCNIDGCQFIAHPKVITKHIQMQHSSGLYKKIAKLNNPEEIEKWREERKKKYPTKNNIDKKAAELKEKIQRGEKMNLGRRDWHSKREDSRGSNSGHGMKRTYNNNNNQPSPKVRKPNRSQKPKILPAPEETRSLAPFTGIQSLVMDSGDEDGKNSNCSDFIEDEIGISDDDLKTMESAETVEKPGICSALSTLMCEYGSSDEDYDDTENAKDKVNKTDKSQEKKYSRIPKQENRNKTSKDLPIEKKTNVVSIIKDIEIKMPLNNVSQVLHGNEIEEVKVPKNNAVKSNIDKLESVQKNDANVEEDNDSGPEEVTVVKNELANISQENIDNKIKKKVEVIRKKPVYRKPKPKLPSTLIYRLLAKEMKQERNQVLQCIRYIRINNYFDT